MPAGTKIDEWEVISGPHKPEGRRGWSKYQCRCKCGREKMIAVGRLKGGARCICTRAPRSSDEPSLGIIPQARWRIIKNLARSRGKPFSVSLLEAEELFTKQEGRCALSGTSIVFSPDPKKTTASLDRIDSLGGYTLENVQWLHRAVNIMKLDLPQAIFISMCKAIADLHA